MAHASVRSVSKRRPPVSEGRVTRRYKTGLWYRRRPIRPTVKTSLQAKEASDANTLLDCIAKLAIPCASQVIFKENFVFFYSENKYVSIHGGLETEGKTYEKLCDILRSGTQICHNQKFPENSLRFCCFLKFPEELDKFPEISLIFHG